MTIKVALLVDDMGLKRWQQQALAEVADHLEITAVLNCTNTHHRRRLARHFGYYVLNGLALRNPLTRSQPLTGIGDCPRIDFASRYQGAWQRLPGEVTQRLKDEGVTLVIKFGMSLLRIDEALDGLDVLSFHHGDPERYRGRPAGFYELLHREEKVGIIVQKLSNTLDGGEVLCRAYSKIHPHSYRKTALAFYANSRYLLKKALEAYLAGERVRLQGLGPNYRLPGNLTVARFCAALATRGLARLCYGALFEKKWNIVTFEARPLARLEGLSIGAGRIPRIGAPYAFYADPFLSHDEHRILVEALNARTGQGDIVELEGECLAVASTLLRGAHYSYPFTFLDEGREYMLPEVASHGSPYAVPLASTGAEARRILLEGLDDLRLADGTLLKHEGRYYLFCGEQGAAANSLLLYVSDALGGPYRAHPGNPVVIDPESSRMGGRILEEDGVRYRLGQNNCRGYGESLTINRIDRLTPEAYRETRLGSVSFRDAKGPHTLDIRGNTMVMDFYTDRFSLLAGYRRLVARLLRR